ncbi:hypothetical protein IYY11_01565 [Methylocystis sp. H62]|uniref:hypothetical protein n=1 Tax=Methylocystis sp. H62 TaxID=2785789 RepID=UPI0018C30838|nr:hypothetical protein [Methylocystis sp. H62]MBG0792166.1 hypothetical protein [Methylocystis sp. H62]
MFPVYKCAGFYSRAQHPFLVPIALLRMPNRERYAFVGGRECLCKDQPNKLLEHIPSGCHFTDFGNIYLVIVFFQRRENVVRWAGHMANHGKEVVGGNQEDKILKRLLSTPPQPKPKNDASVSQKKRGRPKKAGQK